ncbi:hypothetical protein [Nonomuraea sp. NPDC049695]|uniref:hypothetical protein n=1 Tax=Nonomuraea sp. NPDC049695 TaxID=3154734 RepID=UPI0034230197
MAASLLPAIRSIRQLQLYAGVPMVALSLLESLQMNDDKVSDVGKIWKQMARDLDTPVEMLDRLPEESRWGWIADDQREFARVTGDMHTATESLRDGLDQVGDILEGMAGAMRLFKGAMAAYSSMMLACSAYGVGMMCLSPMGAVQGRLYLRWLANAADKVVSVMAGALITYLMGQATILAYLITQGQELGRMAKSYEDGGWPAARLRDVDFSTAKIDRSAYPTFQVPDRGDKLPDAAKDFDWVAPSEPRD